MAVRLELAHLEDIIAVDDAGLDVQFLQETHFDWLGKLQDKLVG